MTWAARVAGSLVAVVLATSLGVWAAWPIYESSWLFVPAISGLVLGFGIAWLGAKRWSLLTSLLALFGVFVLTVVPVAVPRAFESLPSGLLRGLIDGVAGIALGWKQLLTLTLPVGTYQAILVPAYLVFLLSAFFAARIALRGGKFAPLAAVPLVVPVLFGTVFGASELSRPLGGGGFAILAPREITLWLLAAALGAAWVWFSAGASRRAALRIGRVPGEQRRGSGRAARAAIGVGTVLVAIVAGVALAPAISGDVRQVPRDRLDPEIVLRERTSPLASYRTWKRDATLDQALFEVSAEGELPGRLRFAVLDSYDGVDFHVSDDALGRFTRFPSAPQITDATKVSVEVLDGYSDVWVPTAGLGSVPVFSGPRAAELSDAFFVNRNTDASIAVPGGEGTVGLVSGDGFSATMSATPWPSLEGEPLATSSTIDLEAAPELAAWLDSQDQPATAEGLNELIDRLRARGYLSHAISGAAGERLWLDRLGEQYGTQFEPSTGGHSLARIEQLFAELNTQERLAGEDPSPDMLVAAVGDDEQFATAAALIARALGYESRVVVGMRLGEEDAGIGAAGVPGVPACVDLCTGEHVAAWVEVRGNQGDWAAIDVTPQLTVRPSALEEGEQLPEFPTIPEELNAKEVDPPLGFGERSDAGEVSDDGTTASWLWPVLRIIGLVGAAILLLLLPFLFLPMAKRLRERSRKNERVPELRAIGAWQQMVDSALDDGVYVPAGASRQEVAERLGSAPARWAASTADKAVFSPTGITDDEADWMWVAVDADRAERESGLTRRERMWARYSLASYGARLVSWLGGRAESATARSDFDR